MDPVFLFLLGLMTSWAPPAPHDVPRYQSIVQDSLAVAQERLWLPELLPEEQAVVILAIASFETGFDAARDAGVKRGDGGESVCLGSIRVPYDKALRERIAHDRKECFRRILKRVRFSWQQCEKMPFHDRLSKYITGRCEPNTYSRRYSDRILESVAGVREVAYDE